MFIQEKQLERKKTRTDGTKKNMPQLKNQILERNIKRDSHVKNLKVQK